jgi:hypothetical protein
MIPCKYKEYFKEVNPSGRETLQDDKTKLHIRAKNELYLVAVDKGIVKNTSPNIKKCDFLIYDKCNNVSYLIELKGAVIKEAFKQLEASLLNIASISECKFLINSVNLLCAYIVSPKRMDFPRGLGDDEKHIAEALARKCKVKVKNILELIKYIVVVPKTHAFSERDRHIICSSDHPLEI